MNAVLRTRKPIEQLRDHPNLADILPVLAQLPHIADADLPRLAGQWRNSPVLAVARDRALRPDSPLVLEVLTAFEALSALFADDLLGEAPFVTIDPAVTAVALRAVRDALAAAYARPVLTGRQYALLLAPWRAVYPVARAAEPDLGPQADAVKELLAALPMLAGRCHDEQGRALFDALVNRSFVAERDRELAAEQAFSAAVVTSRRRTWALLRRLGAEGLSRPCPTCHRAAREDDESRRVRTLCIDAACALLVTDTLDDDSTELLTAPVRALIPTQHRRT